MATEQEIEEAMRSLFSSEMNLNPNVISLNGVVEQLQSKLGGVDLTHRMDFIRGQIHLLLQPPQQPQQVQANTPNDNFALHQSSNSVFTPSASVASSAFHSLSAQPIELPPNERCSAQTKARRRGGPGGLNKLCSVSPELQAIVGHPALPRTAIVKELWAYIRKNNLQDPKNKRKIICNDELRLVFETDCTDMFKMNKLLAKHIVPLEPTKQSGNKKQNNKTDILSGTRSAEPGPSVMISDELANFMGVSVREMLQSELLRRIWEYIRVNNLEDPVNPMVILCDAKLQDLFGCESISALGIPESLARHIFRRR